MPKPLIALDADGVLLDFHLGYADAWRRAFGEWPEELDPQAYWPNHRWSVGKLEGRRMDHFLAQFDEYFWSNVPAMPGAVRACEQLVAAGYDLVCVSALEPAYQSARLSNLQALGFPIDRVVATGNADGPVSPKARTIAELAPVAFVDDYLPYLRGMPDDVHTALLIRAPNRSPNKGPDLALARSVHQDLPDFTQTWLER